MRLAYIILTVIILLLVALPYGVCCIVAMLHRQAPLWTASWRWTGIALSAVVAVIFIIGFTWGWRQISVTKYRFAHTSVPTAFDGYKIVQLSDFHIGTLSGHPEVVQNIIDSVNALSPDLIVFTGDLVNMHADEEREFHDILRGFKAKDGVVSVMGNHDYLMYAYNHSHNASGKPISREQIEEIHQLQDAERDLGWHLLLNDNYVVRRGADSIAIVGVENDGDGKHFPQYGDLDKAQHDLADGTFKVLLSHDPTHWKRKVLTTTDIPLQLCGHTHAMQFMLFGWSPSRWAYKEWRGPYIYDHIDQFTSGENYRTDCRKKDDGTVCIEGLSDGKSTTGASRTKSTHRTLIVSSGIGEVGVPFRFGAWPEIVEITLRQK